MLLLDDILLAPVHGIFWIFREIGNAADEELAMEPEAITAELTQLYVLLETGKIGEQEFDARERVLLDRLDTLQPDGDDDDDDDAEDDVDAEDEKSYRYAGISAEADRRAEVVDVT